MSVMVITGGTAGAGKATALRFARAGYHVALIARDETGLQETRQACERFGIKTLAISADVVDAGALQRAAAEVETTLGAIDVWINNAMTTVLAPFRQMSEEEFRRVTEVTYFIVLFFFSLFDPGNSLKVMMGPTFVLHKGTVDT